MCVLLATLSRSVFLFDDAMGAINTNDRLNKTSPITKRGEGLMWHVHVLIFGFKLPKVLHEKLLTHEFSAAMR